MPRQPRPKVYFVGVSRKNLSRRGDNVFKRLAADKAVNVSGNITRATLNGSIGPWRAVRRHNHVRQFMERVAGGARRRIASARPVTCISSDLV
jgi:hypothetical protein